MPDSLTVNFVQTSKAEADEQIARLSWHKRDWLQVPLARQIELLQSCQDILADLAEKWVQEASHIKGLDPTRAIAGEVWLTGPYAVAHYLRRLLRALESDRQPSIPQLWQQHAPQARGVRPQQWVAQVFPEDWSDRLLWLGVKGEVWLQPGHPPTQGQREPIAKGQVSLVLGAGNIAAISPLDVLHKLFVEHQVVLLKMNPVNARLGPLIEALFAPLQAEGFFEMVYGDGALGSYLCYHPQVDTVHVTGAQSTFNAIVWGSTLAEQQLRRRIQEPKLTKPITAELGGVLPIVVVPGRWSAADLAFQASQVASTVTHNASFNCVAGQVLVLARGWPQRDAFLDQVRQALRQADPRLAYYPGAQERYQALMEHYPQAEVLGMEAPNAIPWTLIPDVVPQPQEYALTTEAFCGILAETSLDACEPDAFLAAATDFVNQQVAGTLACTLLISGATRRRYRVAFEQAIADLRYGTIGVNVWAGALFLLAALPWGAFPGQTLTDIGSGCGWVHNTAYLDHPQKAVVYAPFRIWPTPSWFPGHRTLRQLGQAAFAFEQHPGLQTLLPLLWAAVRG